LFKQPVLDNALIRYLFSVPSLALCCLMFKDRVVVLSPIKNS